MADRVTETMLIDNALSGKYTNKVGMIFNHRLCQDCAEYVAFELRDLHISSAGINRICTYIIDRYSTCNSLSVIQACIDLTALIRIIFIQEEES